VVSVPKRFVILSFLVLYHFGIATCCMESGVVTMVVEASVEVPASNTTS
jgi:hypothetical protein